MSLRGNNFFHAVKFGRALAPQTVSNATVTGDAIVEPWKEGRQLSFIAVFGDIAAATFTLQVQGRLRSDGSTWEDVQVGGTTLQFTSSKMTDAGAADGGALIGTLDLNVFDGETYEAIRLEGVESATANVPIGVAYVIYDLLVHPSGETDEIFDTQRNAPAA